MASVMSRRMALCALGCSLIALPSSIARAEDQALPTLRVGKAVARNIGYTPLDIGMEYGIFAKNGLAIEELNFAAGAKLAQAMAAGSVDISLSAGPDMAFTAKGAPQIAIAAISESPSFMGYIVGSQSTARGMDELRGKKIGITSSGSLTDWLAEELNRVKGWTRDADRVTKVAIGGSTPATIAALRTGQVDASIGAQELGYEFEEQGQGRLLFNCAQYVGPIEFYTIFAHTDLTRQRADLVRRFLKSWLEAVAFMKTHKDDTVRIASQVTGDRPSVTARAYDSLISQFSSDGRFSAPALATLAASFNDRKLIDGPVNLKQLYTEEFLPSPSKTEAN